MAVGNPKTPGKEQTYLPSERASGQGLTLRTRTAPEATPKPHCLHEEGHKADIQNTFMESKDTLTSKGLK